MPIDDNPGLFLPTLNSFFQVLNKPIVLSCNLHPSVIQKVIVFRADTYEVDISKVEAVVHWQILTFTTRIILPIRHGKPEFVMAKITEIWKLENKLRIVVMTSTLTMLPRGFLDKSCKVRKLQ